MQVKRFRYAATNLSILLLAISPAFALDNISLHGFVDARAGTRTANDPVQDDISLAETRIQLDAERMGDWSTIQIRADLLYDDVVDQDTIDLQTGEGWLDLRQASILLYPAQFMDLKIGRQILTWGTGDLLFINDLFPKDWQSFFAGRDEEYLKAPSDAVLASLFPGWASIYIAYTPRFDADRYISGERNSYWNPMAGRRVGQDAIAMVDQPDDAFSDDEIAVRISRNMGGVEVSLYGYDGFWKSPEGFDPESVQATFPRLAVYGASARGTLAGGIANAETGYYDSKDDASGANPLIPNSEWRALVGYEREVARNVTAALQYYIEYKQDYDTYLRTIDPTQMPDDEDRHVVTLRLTQQAMSQNLTLSLFMYWSPSDEDAYLRPRVDYKVTDEWLVTAGGNFFKGNEPHTFFGQFEDNNNVYAGARYSF